MNNRGQTFFLTVMLGVVVIILALAFAPGLKDHLDDMRGRDLSEHDANQTLDCTNSSISTFNQAACVTTDVSLFYFIGGLIFIAGLVILAKAQIR